MSKVLVKKVEIGGATVSLQSLDGKNWSTSLADLRRFEAARAARRATAQRAFKRIGGSDRWGMSQDKKRSRHFVRSAPPRIVSTGS